MRFSLDFRIYGATAAMFLGAESGILKDLNLDMTISGFAGLRRNGAARGLRNA